MWLSSIGIHTFSIFRRFNYEDIKKILDDFKRYRKATGAIRIIPSNESKKSFMIKYLDERNGINYWLIRFCDSPMGDFKQYMVEAVLNPKVMAGEIDYIRAASERHIPSAIKRFNEESKKISISLGQFFQYSPNRIDYCVNLDLLELGIPCSVEDIMELIRRANVPAHFFERKVYNSRSHRMQSQKNCFYLISKSAVINCYGKYKELYENHPNNPSLGDSRTVIRFEVQCKYQWLYRMSSLLKRKGVPEYGITKELLSDAFARSVIVKRWNQVIMSGDYYTLKEATAKVLIRKFRSGKGHRMLDALNLVSQQRGINSAKEFLPNIGEDFFRFNKAMRELVDVGINPVTIPKRFGIRHIPNLLEAYFDMENSGFSCLDLLDIYFLDCKKYKDKK